MKKVSVVIPCYNAAKYLDKCMIQLLRQTIGIDNIEIILVDDASTDDGNTRGLIAKYEREFPDTIKAIFLNQNLRQGGARNVGIAYAEGEYLVFCDADDWLLEEALEHCYDAAKQYDADVVEFSRTDVKKHDTVVKWERCGRNELVILDTEEKKKRFLVEPGNSYASQSKCFRLSLIKENQIAFAEHLIFEEPSFVVQTLLYERKHCFLDEQLYVSFLSSGSTMRSSWVREHKWDNIFVWTFLIENLSSKGMLDKYYRELEFLFFDWGFGLSLCLPFQKGCTLIKEEIQGVVRITTSLFPNILQNPYILQESNWNQFLRALLEKEIMGLGIADEDVRDVNMFLKKVIIDF